MSWLLLAVVLLLLLLPVLGCTALGHTTGFNRMMPE